MGKTKCWAVICSELVSHPGGAAILQHLVTLCQKLKFGITLCMGHLAREQTLSSVVSLRISMFLLQTSQFLRQQNKMLTSGRPLKCVLFLCSEALGNWWFVAHLTDLLHHCGQLDSHHIRLKNLQFILCSVHLLLSTFDSKKRFILK